MKAAFTPGTTFANYRVESVIGRGGMGIVYLARDLSLDRPVALKLIAPELAEDERFRTRFLREPRLAASLDHPNVVPIYEAGERDGQLYLAMRYVDGTDLKTVLEREGKLAAERVITVLAQVADALDAAHGRGLVHRDVKPANVLVDESGHAYLTDFGVTKQTGGNSTDTAGVVGTLDYLSPEQIRGEPVDGRTDGYALACMLYECLSGKPPFRGSTEAETLWGHMQKDPPPLRGKPALDRVIRKGLAKGKDQRYATCTALVEAAAGALGVQLPRVEAARVRRRIRRRGALLVAGGVLVLGAAAAALIAALGGDDGGDEGPPARNGVAAIDPAGTRLASFTETTAPPSSVAVGEGSVWALGLEDHTVSRIDPETRKVERRFRVGGVPTDIAVGEGAVWIKAGDRLSRVDPRTTRITRRIRLPARGNTDDPFAFSNWGFPQLAVADGAVWAINTDRAVVRVDPDSGRPIAKVDVNAGTIAADGEGAWLISGDDGRSVRRIDPNTNRVGQRIQVGAQNLSAVAVGGGSVWASAEGDGIVWRIEPGRDPITRTIDVGVGVTFLAYGGGAIWTANYNDGTVSRIDVKTNEVDSSPVGAVQGLAAGPDGAWASIAGATSADGLPESCGELVSGGGEPDVLIASDLLLQGPFAAPSRAIADAIRFVLSRHSFKAGRFTVGYRSCDDSNAQTGFFDRRTCAANANAYARAEALVAVIGTYNSACAQIEIPILNRAPGGPLAMISPANTYPGLTRPGLPAPWGYRGEPDVFYPTGRRNFMRVVALDDMHGAAHALLARRLGLRSVYVIDDGSVFWKGLLSEPFRYAARKLRLRVAGVRSVDVDAKDYEAVLDDVQRSGADGVVLGVDPYAGGDRVLNALRNRLGKRVTVMGGFLFAPIPDLLETVGPAAHGMYVTTSDLPRAAFDRTPAAQRFVQEFGEPASADAFVLEGAEAMELVLRAIARSDGTRDSVLEELRATRTPGGLLGSYRLDRNGDISPASVPIVRVTGSTPPGSDLPPQFHGAVLDRVVEIPRRLLR